ncbi:hypothetical protein CYLTODRAFT_378474 [Cylindrobasidium torrendii FP15055 ss-10]|uniref:N-acetyltransferase domain-containing protein n=1 Tax=Cylindrobasidium torrendii FP15055 ss-10 TaxID=1314674 RepID=A0A0D7B736_9AGAR|nr:hypothetical protein CYLTODRAFT_378474 [Cylindrobasidium torrendii FP15055 ss-10]
MVDSIHKFDVKLENERVKLVPFIHPTHSQLMLDAHPPDTLYDLLPLGPFTSVDQFYSSFYSRRIEPNPLTDSLFAVFDKTRAPDAPEKEDGTTFAGMIGFLGTSFANLSTEIAYVVTLPAFQRTHVTGNAIGLLMKYALDTPDNGGLGLRRVQWCASTSNPKSANAAKRMEFVQEGIRRWNWVLSEEQGFLGGNGKALREGDPRPDCVGRDSYVLSVCWDDWENGVRELVEKSMNRKV